jgi:hypothetical protein
MPSTAAMPVASCFTWDNISACNSERKASLNLPKARAAGRRRVRRCEIEGKLRTSYEAVSSGGLGNIDDSAREHIVRVYHVESTR